MPSKKTTTTRRHAPQKQKAVVKCTPPKQPQRQSVAKAPPNGTRHGKVVAQKVRASRTPVEKPVKVEDHARRSPSSLKSREQCPCFEPREGDSVFSTEGHHLHWRMETWVAEVRGLPLPKWKDKEDPKGKPPELTGEQSGLLDKLQHYMLENGLTDFKNVFLERKLDLRPLGLPGCDFGTADFIGITDNVANLTDYKFGKVEVDDPEENVQFHAYALAIFLAHPEVDTINVVALQPRLDCVSTATFRRTDIPALHLRLKAIVERCETMGVLFSEVLNGSASIAGEAFVRAALNPQTSLCEYCAFIGTCPAVAEFALKLVPGPKLPDNLNPHTQLDDENGLGRLFAWAKLCEEKGKALQKEIGRIAQDGHEVNGFHLIKSTTPATLIDPVGLAHLLRKDFKFTDDQIFSCAEIAMSKIEAVVSAQAPKGQKEAAAQAANKKVSSGGFFKPGFGYSYLKKN